MITFLRKTAILLGVFSGLIICIEGNEMISGPDNFKFDESKANILYSLSQFDADCDLQITLQRKSPSLLSFKFIDKGKEILVLEGHQGSVFLTEGNTLFFAHIRLRTFGCTVAAYSLIDGKTIWKTELKAVGAVSHSFYRNQVTLGFVDGSIRITGHESYGDYIEVLDKKSGARLWHKVYRNGFDK